MAYVAVPLTAVAAAAITAVVAGAVVPLAAVAVAAVGIAAVPVRPARTVHGSHCHWRIITKSPQHDRLLLLLFLLL